jgi:hypothetical protein
MRRLKQIGLAVVLMFALATGAMAGIIESPPAPAPASEPVTATGITECPPSAQPTDDNNPVIDLALAVLLTLF